MKLKNTTEWPDHFIRRMVSWCCQQIELSPRSVKRASFGNRSRGSYSGHAWQTMRFHVSIGPASAFPVKPYHYPGRTDDAYLSPHLNDRLEALVAVTAHELTHLRDYERQAGKPMIRAMRRGPGERNTMREERRVAELFRLNRDTLFAEWMKDVSERPANKPSLQDKRAAKAQADLDRWQRKVKLAQTKIRKLKRRVRYYEVSLAAKRS